MKIYYIVKVDYYEFKFAERDEALDFAEMAVRSRVDSGRPVSVHFVEDEEVTA